MSARFLEAAAAPSRWTGILFIVGSAFCFSTMGAVVKDAYAEGASPTGLLAVRMLVASTIWLVLLNRRLFEIEWRSQSVRQLGMGALLGVWLVVVRLDPKRRYKVPDSERSHRRHRARFGARRSAEKFGHLLLDVYARPESTEIDCMLPDKQRVPRTALTGTGCDLIDLDSERKARRS